MERISADRTRSNSAGTSQGSIATHAIDLLRQHIQATERNAQVLDRALQHRAAERGRFEQVGGRLGDQPSLARRRAPRARPARLRCSPLATLPGDSTWQTRSTAPMSIPSSSDAVATTAVRSPCFERLFGRPPLVQADAAMMGAERTARPRSATRSSAAFGQCRLRRLPIASESAGAGSAQRDLSRRRQLLNRAAIVGEDDRRTVFPHQRQQLALRSPARSCQRQPGGPERPRPDDLRDRGHGASRHRRS